MSPSNPPEKSAKEIAGEECSPKKGEAFADNPGKLFARELNTEEAIVESFSPKPREDCSLKKTAKQISAEPFFLAKEGNKQS
jgi:hypothetical protein